MKKRKNGKRKTTTKMKIRENGNRPLKKKRSYIVTVRCERRTRTQNDKSAEVSCMGKKGKKKGKNKSKKKGEDR